MEELEKDAVIPSFEDDVKPKKKKTEAKEADTIEVSRDFLESLLKRVDAVEAAQKKGPVSPRRVTEHTVRIREMEDKYVVGMVKDKYGRVEFKDAVNDKGNPDMIVGLKLLNKDGEVEDKKVFYLLDFLNGTVDVVCKVKGVRKEEIVKIHGTTTKKRVDDYKTIDTGIETQLEDISYKIFTTIELPDGRQVEVEEEALNA